MKNYFIIFIFLLVSLSAESKIEVTGFFGLDNNPKTFIFHSDFGYTFFNHEESRLVPDANHIFYGKVKGELFQNQYDRLEIRNSVISGIKKLPLKDHKGYLISNSQLRLTPKHYYEGIITDISRINCIRDLTIKGLAEEFKDSDLAKLAHLSNIHELSIVDCEITDKASSTIGLFKKLKGLWLDCKGISPKILLKVKIETLHSLSLPGHFDYKKLIPVLSPKIKKLKNLGVSNSNFDDDCLKLISKSCQLNFIDLRWTKVSKEGLTKFIESNTDDLTHIMCSVKLPERLIKVLKEKNILYESTEN